MPIKSVFVLFLCFHRSSPVFHIYQSDPGGPAREYLPGREKIQTRVRTTIEKWREKTILHFCAQIHVCYVHASIFFFFYKVKSTNIYRCIMGQGPGSGTAAVYTNVHLYVVNQQKRLTGCYTRTIYNLT